ncbi:MAG: 50S ribosomal protein L10 [Ruminococcaceae bacterium]|nr:50S ribosomal protein L10 [Oscillospiraceae bacterium]
MPSAKILKEKEALVAAIAEDLKASLTVVFVDYRGITVEQDTELRTELRKAGVEYKVTKNSLTEKAIEQLGIEGVADYLKGPTAIAYCKDEYTKGPKVLADFAKKLDNLSIKGGIMDGAAIDVAAVEKLAKIPSKEVLIGQVAGSLQCIITKLAIGLDEVRKQKESA